VATWRAHCFVSRTDFRSHRLALLGALITLQPRLRLCGPPVTGSSCNALRGLPITLVRCLAFWGAFVPRIAGSHFVGSSVPPLRHQPAALVGRHLIFVDRALDGGLFVGGIIDDADEFRGRAFNVVDSPGMRFWLFGRFAIAG
jgi:hypothetical protein